MKKTYIVIGILVLLAIWLFSSYNSIVTEQQQYTAQWAQVENQYQRRFDLIPNLEATVKGYMKQETAVFTALAEARTRYAGAATQSEKVEATNQVESSLGRLLVVMENYPVLQSIGAVQNLQVELAGTENRVAVERQKYNDTVKNYNLKVMRIPGSIFAKIFGFAQQPYFEAVSGSNVAPKVNLE
ncbi:MAG: LemA family protein [Patescibacteria group bacterium]